MITLQEWWENGFTGWFSLGKNPFELWRKPSEKERDILATPTTQIIKYFGVCMRTNGIYDHVSVDTNYYPGSRFVNNLQETLQYTHQYITTNMLGGRNHGTYHGPAKPVDDIVARYGLQRIYAKTVKRLSGKQNITFHTTHPALLYHLQDVDGFTLGRGLLDKQSADSQASQITKQNQEKEDAMKLQLNKEPYYLGGPRHEMFKIYGEALVGSFVALSQYSKTARQITIEDIKNGFIIGTNPNSCSYIYIYQPTKKLEQAVEQHKRFTNRKITRARLIDQKFIDEIKSTKLKAVIIDGQQLYMSGFRQDMFAKYGLNLVGSVAALDRKAKTGRVITRSDAVAGYISGTDKNTNARIWIYQPTEALKKVVEQERKQPEKKEDKTPMKKNLTDRTNAKPDSIDNKQFCVGGTLENTGLEIQHVTTTTLRTTQGSFATISNGAVTLYHIDNEETWLELSKLVQETNRLRAEHKPLI